MFIDPDVPSPLTPPPRHGVDNIFLALVVSEPCSSEAISIQKHYLLRLGSKPYLVPKECLHVSLLDLGTRKNLASRDISVTIRQAVEALNGLQFESFGVVFDEALSFGTKTGLKPFVLEMSEGREQVALLCQKLKLRLASAGVHSEDKATTPHMTLARATHSVPLESVRPVGWRVTDVVLVQSIVGETRHVYLQRWALQG